MEAKLEILIETGNTRMQIFEAKELIEAVEKKAKSMNMKVTSWTYER